MSTASSLVETQTTWWVVVLRGLAAIAFGVLALIWPGPTPLALVALFSAYAAGGRPDQHRRCVRAPPQLRPVVGGAGGGGRRRARRQSWPLSGPGITGLALLFLLAARAIVVGVFEIVAAVRLRREIEGEWLLAAAGVLSVLFGILVFAFPATGALAVTWAIGWSAIMFGALLIVLGIRLRGVTRPAVTGPRTA